MTTEKVLTDEQINDETRKLYGTLATDQEKRLARAIEQAVLQSPEIQALKKDAYRFQWLIENTDIGVGMNNGYTVIDTREDVDRIMEILPWTK